MGAGVQGGQQYRYGDGGSHEFNPITHVHRKTGMTCYRGADMSGLVQVCASNATAMGVVGSFNAKSHLRDYKVLNGKPKTYRLVYN